MGGNEPPSRTKKREKKTGEKNGNKMEKTWIWENVLSLKLCLGV